MSTQRLGPYEIRQKIGRGGMGTVFEGVDVNTGEPAAIKLLSPELAEHPGFRERFKVEIETLRKLKHPNIVRLFGFGEQGEHLFYAMELIAGSSLEDQLGRGRRFDWHEVTRIGIEAAQALRHAHDRGVIHRDIKPGNLLLDSDGRLKLSDFGIARLFGNLHLTGASGVLGTAEYMPPEQAEGRPVDPRSDLYSLGGVLYVLLARRPLFLGKSFAELIEKQRFAIPEPLRRYAPDIPAELEQIVHQLLDKDPQRRIPNAMILARRLQAMEQSLALGASATETGSPSTDLPPDEPLFAPGRDLAGRQLATTRVATSPEDPPADANLLPTPAVDVPSAEVAPPQAKSPPVGPPEPGSPETPGKPEKSADHFVPVSPAELDPPESDTTSPTWISPQTWILVIALLIVGFILWYSLRPPTADSLFRRINSETDAGTAASALRAEDDIEQFLARFPDDPRGKELRQREREMELSRLERKLELRAKGLLATGSITPIERAYLDALNHASLDPEAGMAKFQAIIDLYGSQTDPSGPTVPCVELAQRRLAQLRKQVDANAHDTLTMIHERLDQADRLRATDPARAKAIYAAVIELYEHKPWAAEAVRRARETQRDAGK